MRAGQAIAAMLLAGAAAIAQYDPFAGARMAQVEGASLAYVERGAGGTPLVLVHGSGADLRTWGYQLQHFAGSRRTIVYSRRFHHPNAPPGSRDSYAPAGHAADLVALIHAVAGGRADVVASSYGGVVALMAARDTPVVIRRLVVVEPVLFSLLEPEAPDARGVEALHLARSQLLDGDAEQAMRTFVSTIIAPGAYDLMPASTREMLRDNLPELRAEARAPLPATAPPFTCADAGGVRVPVLVVDGSASAAFLRAIARKVLECLPKGESHSVVGAAHAVHAQQAGAFNALVQAFLDRP
jgi:pimeloyl-ACP methyl ester carboxylesterase